MIGDNKENTWVFLPGLMETFDINNNGLKNTLTTIAKDANARFIVLEQTTRCVQYSNKLCWPVEDKEVLKTYEYILQQTSRDNVKGWIGFSNGGIYLISLLHERKLNEPVIVIGSADKSNSKQKLKANKLIVMIGEKDSAYYDDSIKLFNEASTEQLNVTLIKYDGEHVLPKNELAALIKN